MFSETIIRSARERRILKIDYRDKDDSSVLRRYVEPYSFTHDDGESGFFAWDIEKNGIRRFSLIRIENAEITEECYSPRYKVEI